MGDIQLAKALAIKGWMSPVELEFLATVSKIKYKILEVGSYKGRSTRALVDNAKGTVTAVDPWNGPYITDNGTLLFDQKSAWNEFQRNLSDASNLEIFRGTFEEFDKVNKDFDFDFVFIDGDHRYNAVMHDIQVGLKILRPGGILAGHDYSHPDWPGVRRAVDELFPRVEIIGSIWWTQRS